MIIESTSRKLAGIRPAPLCGDSGRGLTRRMATASSLPSLARLGMFKSTNDAKSRFIQRHIKAATAEALASIAAAATAEAVPGGRQGGSCNADFPKTPASDPETKVFAEPLAVMATQGRLEQYRRRKRAHGSGEHGEKLRRRWRCDRHAPLLGEERYRKCRRQLEKRDARSGFVINYATSSTARSSWNRPEYQLQVPERSDKTRSLTAISRAQTLKGVKPRDHERHNHSRVLTNNGSATSAIHLPVPSRKTSPLRRPFDPDDVRGRPTGKSQPASHVVQLPHGGSVLVGPGGIRKSQFPRGCEPVGRLHHREGERGTGDESSGTDGDVVARLCDPKKYTGTAASGHLPTTVDLEGGVGVLLKDAPITVKDHVGAQEISWRLRLAERL